MENQINDDIFSPDSSCIQCCDTGFYYDGSIREYCACVAGADLEDSEAREDHHDSYDHDDYEGYSWDDVEADANTLASAGYGTDEDYGMIGGDSDLMGEW
jgi:hypothetical protein